MLISKAKHSYTFTMFLSQKRKNNVEKTHTTRLKKKAAPYFKLMYKQKKMLENFSVKVI